jgi:hypothetical protein
MARRFRWTRASYRKAQHLSRLIRHLPHCFDDAPEIVKRFWQLWGDWDQKHGWRDPLEIPLSRRLAERRNDEDGIPF